jgi:hypothetical protein
VTNVLFGKFVLGKAITRPMLVGTSLTVLAFFSSLKVLLKLTLTLFT